MNKSELVHTIAQKSGIARSDAKKSLDAFIDVVGHTLKEGDSITLVGFGSFSISRQPARTGRNFKTGAPVRIAPKNVVRFRPGIELCAKVQ